MTYTKYENLWKHITDREKNYSVEMVHSKEEFKKFYANHDLPPEEFNFISIESDYLRKHESLDYYKDYRHFRLTNNKTFDRFVIQFNKEYGSFSVESNGIVADGELSKLVQRLYDYPKWVEELRSLEIMHSL